VLNEIRKMREITLIVCEQVLGFTLGIADRLMVIEKGNFIHEDKPGEVEATKIKGCLSV
jgi:urea transport system ATP-binding protein